MLIVGGTRLRWTAREEMTASPPPLAPRGGPRWGSGSWVWIAGGPRWRWTARGEMPASPPPLAPRRWPSWLLVELMVSFFAWSPKVFLTALVSARSPRGVLVPWALM